jgi:hypothetical protein
MKARLIATFTLFLFMAGISVEIGSFHSDDDHTSIATTSAQDIVTIEGDHQNWPEDDHDDSDGHCAHHCNGLHNISLVSRDISVVSPYSSTVTQFWSFGFIYQSPFIDPALKPPTFS